MPDPTAPATQVLTQPSKPWYSSLTIIAASLVGLLQLVPGAVAQIDTVIPTAHIAANPVVIQVLSIIGIIVAIYGRFTATKTIA